MLLVMDRRKFMLSGGAVLTTTIAGCSGGSSDDDYESGSGDDGGNGDDGDEELAEITEHSFHEEQGDYSDDVWVEGTVVNNDDDLLDYVEVSVRAFNEDGQQIDSFMTNTSDLAGGAEWPFEVEMGYAVDYGEVDEYEIALDFSQY